MLSLDRYMTTYSPISWRPSLVNVIYQRSEILAQFYFSYMILLSKAMNSYESS